MKTTKMEADPTAQAAGLPLARALPAADPKKPDPLAGPAVVVVWTPVTFATQMWALSLAFKFSCTSWGRTPARNKLVGGVADSHHMTWTAMDCVLDDPTHDSFAFVEACQKAGFQCDLSEKTHIHVEVP